MGGPVCNLVGQTGEAAVAAQLAAAGFHVYVPIFCPPESDMIAEKGGRLLRIQVKTSAGDTAALRFMAQTAGVHSYADTADWLAFYSTYYGVTAFLKPSEVGARPTLRYDDELGRQPGARYASDYSLERIIKETSR